MRTPEQIAALRAACESWAGTPFCPNSAVKGVGVCCHKFCGSAYMEAGWLPVFKMPDGYPYGSEANTTSPFETWLDASPLFLDADPGRGCTRSAPEVWMGHLEPGDLILSKPSRLPWHLAIFLGGAFFAHVDMRQGVQVTDTFPAAWARRVVRIYRPVEQ